MSREFTEKHKKELETKIAKARKALEEVRSYDQERVDRLSQKVGWAIANKKTFGKLSREGVEESGLGDKEGRVGKRFKVKGILRDTLRQKSVGKIEEDIEKGITKYAKPAGLIASVIPTTNPVLTPAGTAVYAVNARDAVIFSPHPRSKNTAKKAVDIMRKALEEEGAPADLLQCIENVSIPMTQKLMAEADLVMATGGSSLVEAAYSSGTPAYGVGTGNSTMVIDETADIKEAAHNTMRSKTSDFGSGCSADGNLVIQEDIYDEMIEQLVKEGGYLVEDEEESEALRKILWDDEGHRLGGGTVAVPPQTLAEKAGFSIPEDRKFIIVEGTTPEEEEYFSREKLTTLLTTYKYSDFSEAEKMVRDIFNRMGKGHSCGIYSFNEDHIDRHAKNAPVSRIMVRQPNSKANAGSFTNGMPMTSSLGCGTWGGNITNENINLKHYLNITWVAKPIVKDKPSDEVLFGEFYDPSLEE